MKALESGMFDSYYPEKFDWNQLDSHHGVKLAMELTERIRRELAEKDGKRLNVPGLRYALVCIAEEFDVV